MSRISLEAPPTLLASGCLPAGQDTKNAAVCNSLHTSRSILFLVDQLTELGGGERALFQLAQELPRHGYRVFVVTFRDKPDPLVYTLFDRILILPLTSCFSLRAIQVARQLRHLIRRERIDIVQTFFESADTFGALVAITSRRCHVVSSRRDMGILRSRKHHIAYRVLGKRYSAVLAVSAQVREWHIRTDHLDERIVHTLHNGLSLDRFQQAFDRSSVRETYGLSANVPLVTTISNINEWKGVDVFLKAAALIHKVHPLAEFAVAGSCADPGLLHSLMQLAALLGIEDRVHFLGNIADVAPLLSCSSVFALLSRSEGFPNVVIEAMASRLPVVATAVGGTPEAVDDGITGFLVNSEDAEGAAFHINRLLSEPWLRSKVGSAGLRRLEQHFSLDQVVSRHREIYHALLA